MSEKPAEEIVRELVDARDVERLQALAAGKDKALAKAARRGLHLLRTKGVEAEAPRAPAPATPPVAVGERPEAWTGIPDRRGVRLVSLCQPSPSGGFDFAHVMLSDERGVEDAAVGRGPKKAFREARRHFEGSGLLVSEIPLEYALALVTRAYDLTLALGRSPPADYAVARRVFAGRPAATQADIERALAEIPAPAWTPAGAAALHDLPDLFHWIAPNDVLDALGLRWEEIATSTLLVDDAQRLRARHDAVDKAVARVADDAGRARWQRRLLDAAMVYAAAGDVRAAGLCKAEAAHLGEPGVDPVGDPFCRKLVEKVLPKGALEEVSAPGGGLIVTP
jgi:hypothetical protein